MKLLRALAFLFLLSFGSTIVFLQFMGSGGDMTGATRITVTSGMNVQEVADVLKEHGLITSALAFRLYLKSRGLDTMIQPGTMGIPMDASFAEIAAMLSSKEGKQITVTIPEGYTVKQIDALLAKLNLVSSGELIACAALTCDFSSFGFLPKTAHPKSIGGTPEGYLFPDTYFVDPSNFTPKFFLERMLVTFRSRVLEGELSEDIVNSKRSLAEIIEMASLIEREAGADIERAMISGILWKRFDGGIGLDVDATIRYALGKETEPLSQYDLAVDSPYNTRKYSGLPPGPIANPGLASIKAALRPEDSPHWYYLHGSDGIIRYAETNEEHNENKARYL